MRKLMGLTAMAFAMSATTPATATPVVAPPIPVLGCTSEYVVQPGDTLWDLAELKLNNPALWSWLVEQNPILQEPGRYFVENGKEIVRINPGEKLFCLDEVGINRPAAEVLRPPEFVGENIVVPVVAEKTFVDYLGDWWWLLLLVAAAVAAWWLYRESRKDPVNSGSPQTPGGVNTVAAARIRFESRANQEHFTVLHVVPGTIHGTMMVRYGDGTERPRVLSGERAYQATIRRADGTTEDIYMLQRCGNDLRFGGIARYIPGPNFRFVPDSAAAAQTAADPASVIDGAVNTVTTPTAADKPELKIELKPAETDGGTAMVRITGAPTEDMVLSISNDSLTLRFHPVKN